MVEFEFFSFQDIAVSTTALSGAGADAGEQSLLSELVGNLGVNDSVLLAIFNSTLGSFGFSLLNLHVLSFLGGEVDTVVVGVPLREGSGVNLNDAVLDEGVGSDQLVVGGVVDDIEDSGLAGDSFGGPVEVTFLKPEGSELEVSSSDSDTSDSGGVRDEFGVGDGSGLLEGSLLFVDRHSASCKSALVPGISVDAHSMWLI